MVRVWWGVGGGGGGWKDRIFSGFLFWCHRLGESGPAITEGGPHLTSWYYSSLSFSFSLNFKQKYNRSFHITYIYIHAVQSEVGAQIRNEL
jgi:hypothetical protein